LDIIEWHFDFETENRWKIDKNNEKSENICTGYVACSIFIFVSKNMYTLQWIPKWKMENISENLENLTLSVGKNTCIYM
jgi:hypothetical protein